VPGIESQWRSGAGVTANGALVYIEGPALSPLQLAQLLVRAGVVRGMELDINPNWPVFATYNPPTPNGLAAPSNGSSLQPSSVQNATTFFSPAYARDFITVSVASTAALVKRPTSDEGGHFVSATVHPAHAYSRGCGRFLTAVVAVVVGLSSMVGQVNASPVRGPRSQRRLMAQTPPGTVGARRESEAGDDELAN